ncbi:DUF4870 domain-containing protein [Natronococcus sp. A-GB1]|uniref:DUF4870 domain-containing protein n=1 Tax=Natronococcus sp. A-GB1 TaxID=3037648 RepID=UPI00241FCC12|nr:DUF4870 domain-containing protein [Natronococcus sp. A-GB1]MDG5758869.1 DUF4870 domain-containing protein [Natronococcus sp. A-GB1]
MSTNPSSTDSSSTAPSRQPGPELLAERSILGIFVHLVGAIPLWGILLSGLLYRFSSHEFTRANARIALNWQTLVTSAWIVAFVGLFGLSELTDQVALPGALETVLSLPVLAAVIATFVLTWLNILFPVVGMGKAVFGDAWEYPMVPDLVRLVSARTRFGSE